MVGAEQKFCVEVSLDVLAKYRLRDGRRADGDTTRLQRLHRCRYGLAGHWVDKKIHIRPGRE